MLQPVFFFIFLNRQQEAIKIIEDVAHTMYEKETIFGSYFGNIFFHKFIVLTVNYRTGERNQFCW
jgi:hypothetical protein